MKRAPRPRQAGSSFARWPFLAILVIALTACAPQAARTEPPSLVRQPTATVSVSSDTEAPAAPTAQPAAPAASYGPDASHFPQGINPLTGQPVTQPDLLKTPALLVSISHFPATARPQAGLSFSPFVYEFSITGGETRFLTTFYGEEPAPEIPIQGNCAVRQGLFLKTSTLLGNRVWLDSNHDGVQAVGEPGIGGVCVKLYDQAGDKVAETTTDSNGYYGFNVQAGRTYSIEFVKPSYLDFTRPNIGNENDDSDANPQSGQIANVKVTSDDLLEDAGMLPNASFVVPTPDPKTAPKAQVGPVRSGRLLYGYIANYMQDSCLIYAFASKEVLPLIPKCAFVTHEVSGGGNMLDISRMNAIAAENRRNTAGYPFDYASNLYADKVPSGGSPASRINVFFASLNQSAWSYDPLYGAYLRQVDTADKNAPGVLHFDVDRLTGRQLHFENVIVIMADTDVVSPTNINIHLDQGNTGYAFLFRDGQMFPIRWSTRSGDYEKQTGHRRPIQFLNADGSPAALKPGHTWAIIVTPFSTMKATQPGVYLVAYAAPEGEAR